MRAVTVAVATLVVFGAGGCSGTTPPAPAPSASTTSSASTGPTGSPTGSPTESPATWSSSPVVVTKTIPVPPVPQLIAIRSAPHPDEGYDRIVFDFVRTIPGYEIRYVDTVTADGSGEPVTVPGRRYLKIVFRPAQAHDESGTQSVTPRAQTLDYPMLRAYVITGDFEAVLSVVLGLDDVVGFRVGELPGEPGRLYVDVAA